MCYNYIASKRGNTALCRERKPKRATVMEETILIGETEKGRRQTAEKKLARRLAKLTNEAIDCLEEILTDKEAKPADRIAAAKLAFDAAGRKSAEPEPVSDGTLRVIFDGCPKEYAE